VVKIRLGPAQAGWQIDLDSPFREPQGRTTLRNSDQIDSGTPVVSVRDIKALLEVVVNSKIKEVNHERIDLT
jgi:hypothetical protein